MIKLKIILGSTRQGRFGDKAAKWLSDEVKKKTNFASELLDLRDYPMPFFDEAITPSMTPNGYGKPEAVVKWTAKIKEGEAFVIVTPEYNHGYSAVLKNALDYNYHFWNNKPVAFVSYGSVGGARSVEQLRLVAVELQMAPIRQAVHIFNPWFLLDDKGDLKSGALEAFNDAADKMLDQLAWWAEALKAARVIQYN